VVSTTRAIGDNHIGGTGLRVSWVQTLVVHRADSHRVDTVGVPIEVALIAFVASIPAREDEDGALPTSSVVDSIEDGFSDNI